MKRPSATFSKGKHSVLNSFRYAIKQFLYNITLENKSNKTYERQPV